MYLQYVTVESVNIKKKISTTNLWILSLSLHLYGCEFPSSIGRIVLEKVQPTTVTLLFWDLDRFQGVLFYYLQVIWLTDQSWHLDFDFFLEQISVLILLESLDSKTHLTYFRFVWWRPPLQACLFPFGNTFWFCVFASICKHILIFIISKEGF